MSTLRTTAVRRVGLLVSLMVVWVLLWDDFSFAVFLTGFLVAAGLVLVFPPDHRSRQNWTVRPGWALVHLVRFSWLLVLSNIDVAREVLSIRRSRIAEGVIEVPLVDMPVGLAVSYASSISLTPGTLTVELRAEERKAFVHGLFVSEPDALRRQVLELQRSWLRAFGTAESVAAIEGILARPDLGVGR